LGGKKTVGRYRNPTVLVIYLSTKLRKNFAPLQCGGCQKGGQPSKQPAHHWHR
jgi:hypothetical protein